MSDELPIGCTCECGRSFKVKAKAAGRSVKCPSCQGAVLVPEPIAIEAAVPDDWPQLDPLEVPPPLNVQQSPYAAPLITRQPTQPVTPVNEHLPESRKYRALEIIVAICYGLALVVFALSTAFLLLSLLFALMAGNQSAGVGTFLIAWLMTSVPATVGAWLVAIGLLTQAEMIQLAMHVQSNTLATARAVARLR
jgi:hypothetical protein